MTSQEHKSAAFLLELYITLVGTLLLFGYHFTTYSNSKFFSLGTVFVLVMSFSGVKFNHIFYLGFINKNIDVEPILSERELVTTCVTILVCSVLKFTVTETFCLCLYINYVSISSKMIYRIRKHIKD